MSKFKVGDKARVRRDLKIGWSYGEWCFNDKMKAFKGGELTIKRVHNDMYEVEENIWKWTDEMLEEVKESKMEKTFREVISDIKEGEVWEGGNPSKIRIRCSSQGIEIKGLDNWGYIGKNVMFKLQRKEYTFEEAFKAYEEGKEIESDFSGCRYKKENGKDTFIFKADWNEFDCIELDEIRSKWYIND